MEYLWEVSIIFSTAFQWAAEVTSQASLLFQEEHNFVGGIGETWEQYLIVLHCELLGDYPVS